VTRLSAVVFDLDGPLYDTGRMRRAFLLAPLLLSFDVLAAGRTLPVPNASFDSGPGGWTLEGQNASPRIDGPRKSLLLESGVPARLTAELERPR